MSRSRKMGYILFGMLTMVFIYSAVIPAIASTTARRQQITVTYDDIKVVVNGVPLERDGAGNPIREPFMLDRVTMVPARVIGERLANGVTSWDADTRTLYIGPRPGTQAESVRLSNLDWFSRDGQGFLHSEQVRANTGDYYSDCIYRDIAYGGGTRDYLINGQYRKISGTLFLAYDSIGGTAIGKFNIWGDGKLLYSSNEVKDGVLPVYFEVDISNVTRLKIGFEGVRTTWRGNMVISEVTLHR
jgi:hypothetical protein